MLVYQRVYFFGVSHGPPCCCCIPPAVAHHGPLGPPVLAKCQHGHKDPSADAQPLPWLDPMGNYMGSNGGETILDPDKQASEKWKSQFLPNSSQSTKLSIWVCLKIGYTPNEIAI